MVAYERRELLPQLKNQVFEILQARDLDHSEFAWQLIIWDHYEVSRLFHARTGVFFLFAFASATPTNYGPRSYPTTFSVPNLGFTTEQMIRAFTQWADHIAPELKAPDLWRIAATQAPIGGNRESENTPFTPDELKQVTVVVRQLEEFVYKAETQLPAAQKTAIAARFSYLEKAASRLGRVDWTTIVVGEMFSMTAERLITVETFRSLYHMLSGFVQTVLAIASNLRVLLP